MGRILFTDAIGPAVLHNNKIGPASRFSNWTPRPMPVGDKANRQSDGALTRFRVRDDFGASFEIAGIPVQSVKTNLIESNGDIVGTIGAAPTGIAGAAPNTVVVALGVSPGGMGQNGLIAKHTRDTGTADTNTGGYGLTVVNGHHLTGSVWVYIPSASIASAISLAWETNVSSVVTANADMTKRDQWQLLTTTATATGVTSGIVLRMIGATGSVAYSDAWAVTDADDGLVTRYVDIADRLAYHLENGGSCQVETGDYDNSLYATCGLYPGANATGPVLTDKRTLEHTLSLNLVNLAASPARMRCHYA